MSKGSSFIGVIKMDYHFNEERKANHGGQIHLKAENFIEELYVRKFAQILCWRKK